MGQKSTNTSSSAILEQLFAILKERKHSTLEKSYVASLYKQGLSKITRKVMEEAFEAVQATYELKTKPQDITLKNNLVNELADLWFHSLVMASDSGVELDEITTELQKRMGISGITEKQNRPKK